MAFGVSRLGYKVTRQGAAERVCIERGGCLGLGTSSTWKFEKKCGSRNVAGWLAGWEGRVNTIGRDKCDEQDNARAGEEQQTYRCLTLRSVPAYLARVELNVMNADRSGERKQVVDGRRCVHDDAGGTDIYGVGTSKIHDLRM